MVGQVGVDPVRGDGIGPLPQGPRCRAHQGSKLLLLRLQAGYSVKAVRPALPAGMHSLLLVKVGCREESATSSRHVRAGSGRGTEEATLAWRTGLGHWRRPGVMHACRT